MLLPAGGARARVRHDASCGNMCAAMCACAVSTGHCSMLPRELSKPPCRKHRRLRQPRHTCIQRCEALSAQIRSPTTPPTTTLRPAPHNRRPCVHATHAHQHCIHAWTNGPTSTIQHATGQPVSYSTCVEYVSSISSLPFVAYSNVASAHYVTSVKSHVALVIDLCLGLVFLPHKRYTSCLI